MKLVVDTNILFSFCRENPVRKIIVDANKFGLELFTPEYAFEELKQNKQDIKKYANLEHDRDVEFIFNTLRLFVETKPMTFFKEYKDKAEEVTPDQKDAPFFALALKLNADLWSNEPRLKRQSTIKVLTTGELRELLGQ